MGAVTNNSTLYGGDITKSVIYEIDNGVGNEWAEDIRTEFPVDGKPKELRRAYDEGNPIVVNVKNPRDTDFTGANNGSTIFDVRNLEVTEFMVPRTYDVAQFKEDFPRFQPKGNNIDLKANPEITKVIFDRIKNAIDTQLGNNHSVGDSAGVTPLNLYDGFETLILAGSGTQVGVGAALTPANVIERFFALRTSVPTRLRKRKNLVLHCSHTAADMFSDALRSTQDTKTTIEINGQTYIPFTNGGKVEIKPKDGLSTDFFFITPSGKGSDSNLVQGFWSKNEQDLLKMYRTEEADQIWKILSRFDIGVQYVADEDIFYSTGV